MSMCVVVVVGVMWVTVGDETVCVSAWVYVSMWLRKLKITVIKQINYQSIHAPHTVSDMAPRERVNMSTFNASELTHATPHSV